MTSKAWDWDDEFDSLMNVLLTATRDMQFQLREIDERWGKKGWSLSQTLHDMSKKYDEDYQRGYPIEIPEDEPAGKPIHVPGLTIMLANPYKRYVKKEDKKKVEEREKREEMKAKEATVVTHTWHMKSKKCLVTVQKDAKTGKVLRKAVTFIGMNRFDIIRDTLAAANKAWDLDAEMKAMEKLKDMVIPRHYKQYITTGMFMEVSKRSRVRYVLRKCRPTLAYSAGRQFLASLCVHSMGYYAGTWAGVMVPTDDVINHLMMIRGDEYNLWKKSTHHPEDEPQGGF